jgi:hypothetical protein
MCATASVSYEDLLPSSSGDLLISTISRITSGSHNYEALLRVITKDECDCCNNIVPTGRVEPYFCYSYPILFSHMLLFHFTTFPYHFIDSSLTSFSPCCFLMLLLSLTHLDSFSHHESSLPVLLPLVRARFSHLFKNVVTTCISLT